MTLKNFIKKNGLTMKVERATSNKHWDGPSANHYRCTLKGNDKSRMTVPFSQGLGIRCEPTIESVLECLASDAAGYENGKNFEGWISEYGYQPKEGRKIYKSVEKQTEKLRNFLGDEAFETLLWRTQNK